MASPIKLSPMVAPFLVEAPGLKELEKIQKDVGKISKKIGDSIGGLGKTMTAGLTLPLVGAAGAAVKLSVDANRSLASIGTLIPGQRDKLNAYKEDLGKLSVETAKPFEELSDGLYQSISALGDSKEAFTALEIANKAAIGGISDTSSAISLLSGVAKGYNSVNEETLQKISDLSFTTVKLGVTTFPELAANMGKIAPIASSLNISLEEMFGDMATLTGVTGNTAEVSTQLASVMGALLKGSTDLDKAYKKLGVKSGKELIDKTGGLNNALEALKGSVKGSEKEFAKLLGRKEAILAAFALTGNQADSAKMKISAMNNVVGASDAAFREQTDGINKAEFTFKKFIETIKFAGRAIGDRLLPRLDMLGEYIKPLAEKFSLLNDEQVDNIIKIGGIIAAIGPMLMVVGKLTTLVGGLVGALGAGGGLAGVLVTLTGPVGWVVGGLILLGAATAYFWDELKPVRDVFRDEFVQLFTNADDKTRTFSNTFKDLGNTLKGFVRIAAPVWASFAKINLKIALFPAKKLITWIKRIVRVAENLFSIFNSVLGIFKGLIGVVGELWKAFKGWFNDMADKYTILGAMRSAFRSISRSIKEAYKWLSKMVDKIPDLPVWLTDKLAAETAAGGGFIQRQFKEIEREVSTKREKMEVDIKVDANGAKTGVRVKGANAKVKDSNGSVMPVGDPV